MFELTVKTLDGRDHAFTLPEEVSVSDFKQQISRSLDIPPHEQRLIFRGKVLNDDFVLKASEMDRKVLHLVTRPPPSQVPSQTPDEGTMPHEATQVDPGVYIGEINISSFISPNRIQEIVQHVMEQIGMTQDDANLTVTDRGGGVEIQIDLGSSQELLTRRDVHQRLQNIRDMISNMSRLLEDLEQNCANSDTIPVFSPCPYTAAANCVQNQVGMATDASSSDIPQQSSSSSQDTSQTVYEYDSILHDFNILNQRLSRFIALYGEHVNRTTQASLSPPSQQEQILLTQLPFLLHLMSHIYHNISDLAFVAPTSERQASVSVNSSAQDQHQPQQQQPADRSTNRNQNAVTIELNQGAGQTPTAPFHQQIMSAITEAINPILGLQQQRPARQSGPGTIVLNHVIAQIVDDDESSAGGGQRPQSGGLSTTGGRFRIEGQRPLARSMVVTTNRPINVRPPSYPPPPPGYNPFPAAYQRMPQPMFDYQPYPAAAVMNYPHFHSAAYPSMTIPCQQHSALMYPQMMRPNFYYYPPAPQIRISQGRPSLFIPPGVPAYPADLSQVTSTIGRPRMTSNSTVGLQNSADASRAAGRQAGQPSADPYLPCFSGFHDALRGGRDQGTRGQAGASLSPPEQIIADILSQLLPPLFNSGRERVQVLIGNASPSANANPRAAAPPATTPRAEVRATEQQHATAPSLPPTEEDNPQIPTSQTFREISEIIEFGRNPPEGSNLPEMTLSTLLNQMMDPERNIFEESMRLVTTNLTFGNLLELLDGNVVQEGFENCLEKLTDFLSEVRIIQNRERYRSYFVARQFADSLLRSLSLDLSRLRTRRGISAFRSIQAFVRYSSFQIVDALLSDEPLEVRKQNVREQIKSICMQIGPLLREIFVDADDLLSRLQSGRLRSVFRGVPRQLLPLIELFARVMPRYIADDDSADDREIERYIVLEDDSVLSGDEDLVPIVEIDRMRFRKVPVPRAKSEAYMSMIPHKRRRAAKYAVNTTNPEEIHRIILRRAGEIFTDENDDTHPAMRQSVLQSIQQDADESLSESFRQKLRSLMRERVSSDEDFELLQDRFPNLRRLFQ